MMAQNGLKAAGILTPISSMQRKRSFVMPQSVIAQIVLQFIPSWFAVNMGTGVVSVLLHVAPHQFPGLCYVAIAFYALNVFLFLAFLGISVARYTIYPWVFFRMLRHPTICLFLGTVPMALCTIINATALIAVPAFGRGAVVLVHVLWWIDVALTLASSFLIPFVMFHIHDLLLENMTAVWLLPIVPTVVAAASGGIVAPLLAPGTAMIVIAVSYMLWGIGMTLSIIVLAMYFHRLTVHSLPNSEVIVSAFLPLGPCGQGAAGLIALAQAVQQVFPVVGFAHAELASTIVLVVSVLLGVMIWGVGLWWLAHGVLSLLTRYLYGGMRFSIAMWGLIFPYGVFTLATVALSQVIPSVFLSWLATVFIALLVLLWAFVAACTVQNAWNRSLFVAPCLSTGPTNLESEHNLAGLEQPVL